MSKKTLNHSMQDAQLAEFLAQIQESSVWSVAKVGAQPEIKLCNWQVLQIQNGDRHFVGWNIGDSEGRVSSKIMVFDPLSARGATASGRIYQLHGTTGRNGDGAHVWSWWSRNNDVKSCVDVSAQVQSMIDAATRGWGEA